MRNKGEENVSNDAKNLTCSKLFKEENVQLFSSRVAVVVYATQYTQK